MYILGINSAYHESSACLLKDGVIVAAVEEERFTRVKHAKTARIDNPDELPLMAIRSCLDTAGISIEQVELIGFSLNPRKRMKNKDYQEFKTQNSWGTSTGEEGFFKKVSLVPNKLEEMGFQGQFLWLDHHLCHCASAFYSSGFAESGVLIVDGIGEFSSTTFVHGKHNKLHLLEEIMYPASVGFLWEKISKFLGFTEYDACKVMGLAAYGDTQRYMNHFKQLIRFIPEGKFELDINLLRFRVEDYSLLEDLFGISKRECGQILKQEHQDIAASLQSITDQLMMHMVKHLYEQTKSENLCLAGGVALNCVSNRFVFESGPFTNLYIQPAAHDAGTAVGAALFLWNQILGKEPVEVEEHIYLGPCFHEAEIEKVLKERNIVFEFVNDIEKTVARLVSENNIVSWFQGRLEFGPRALGNRSILADPRNPKMRQILNNKVKHREDFRPFAASILDEEVHKWFNVIKPTSASDYMLVTYSTKEASIAKIPAVIHVDGTSRIQTVKKKNNFRYHQLISEFFKITGVPLLLNTSFNDSEPIVCTPNDSIDTFVKTQIDYLVLGNLLVDRKKQNCFH